jgi:hypothetical protein
MDCLESKILKTKMFDFWCVNIESWKVKFVCEMFGIWKFENKNVWIGMCEYLKLKTEIWNFYVKHLEFKNLKTKMFEFKCENIESWKLKN